MKKRPQTKAYEFNPDPHWQEQMLRYEPVIESIALKYCTGDNDLRNDLQQEAMIGLATVFPARIQGFAEFEAGTLSLKNWQGRVDRYCRNVIRNSILSYLHSYVTGQWYTGRTQRVPDAATGEVRRVTLPARYVSLDALYKEPESEVDEHGGVNPSTKFEYFTLWQPELANEEQSDEGTEETD